MNGFLNLNFISVNKYGRVWDKSLIEDYAMRVRDESGVEFNPWEFMESINRTYHKDKNIDGRKLYSSWVGALIRNYKKHNYGKTNREWNKIIRDYLKEIIWVSDLFNVCIIKYGGSI